ncbi:MAG: hypothetical protein EOP32_24030 [Rhodococcus sp. (in: high G+C Gram-positive bacteria)]|nr:MAG: hypothetical protein EOP32_24030 [Rhodococcus sp. (in: high G+C Gram-positive bacteria)]
MYHQLGGFLTDGYDHWMPTHAAFDLQPDVTALAAGFGHSLALKNDGSVWAWGFNKFGQLGDGTTVDRPQPVPTLLTSGAVAIASNGNHSLALKNDGGVWAWGYNQFGEVGDGTEFNDRPTPVRVERLDSVVGIAAGGYHSVAVKDDGSVWTWGYNLDGQLGNGTSGYRELTPVEVVNLRGVTTAAAGRAHNLVLQTERD